MSKFFNEIIGFFHFCLYQIGLSPFGLSVLLLTFIGINIGFYFLIKKIFKGKIVKALSTILGLAISLGIIYLLAVTAGQAIRFVKYPVPFILLDETDMKLEKRVFIRYSIFVSKPYHFNNGTIVAYKDPDSKTKYIAKIMNDLGNGQYEVVSTDENGNLLVRNIYHSWITAKD